jgi:hypothetical protein
MGKDREGKFHPAKGRPTGAMNENAGVQPISTGAFEESLEIADKYTVGDDEPSPHLRIRHRNRNVDKREDRQKQRNEIKDTKTKRETMTSVPSETVAEQLLTVTSKEQFAELANYQSSCCISAYMATHDRGAEVNENMDATIFKNILQQVNAQLKQKNISQVEIDKMLKPGFDLLRNEKFWYEMTPGFAVFMADGFFKYMKMPCRPKEEILINSSFYITPLLPVMSNTDYFYLLVLSKKQAKLFKADAFGMNYIRVDELPDGVDDVVHFEEKDDQKLWRTGSSGAGGGANYHGIGAGKPDDKENIAMYFDEVDETLHEFVLGQETAPLLLAGVDYLIPIYKSVAKYKPIWDDALIGNFEREASESLYQQARKKMEKYFDERHSKALEAYWNQSATALTSSIPADVIPAAHYKQVWHLFVQKGEHIWGTFDEMNNKLTVHETQLEGDECLIDRAVIKTILNGGEVHVLPKDRMPGESKIAALMRYQQ